MKKIILFLFVLTVFANAKAQNTMSTAVDIGSKSVAFTYTNTLNTNNYTDDYTTAKGGRSAKDVYYKFTLTRPMAITISHCESELSDTYLHLLNALGTRIAYNDDGGSACAPDGSRRLRSFLEITLAPGTYYIVSEGFSQNGNITTAVTGKLPTDVVYFDLGSKSDAFTLTSTLNTSTASNIYGQSGNDIFLKLTLTKDMEITISHCGSAVADTYVHLLDSEGTSIAINNDYTGSGACANTKHAYLKRILNVGTYYIVSEGVSQNGSISTKVDGQLPPPLVINLGTQGAAFSYSNAQKPAYFGNYYSGQTTNDVRYQFTLTQTMEISIEHSGSALSNTFMYLLDSTEKLIKSSNQAFTITLNPGSYSVITEGFGNLFTGNFVTRVEGIIPFLPPKNSTIAVPNQSENYIKTRSYLSQDESSFIDAVQYYDGLGRPTQSVQVGITPDQKDLITVQEYDPMGRDAKIWLPITQANNVGKIFSGNILNQAKTNHENDTYPYAEPIYEASPLNRIQSQYGAGAAWRTGAGKPVKTDYLSNNDSLICFRYSVSGDNLVKNGNYTNNTLFVTKTTDEDSKVAYEFRNKQDQVILQRQMNGNEKHDTYFVYDDFGNLRFVLPPAITDATQSQLDLYAYIYKYDSRNRCIEKRLPGTDRIEYIYDATDRLIATRDGELRQKGHWYLSLPDALGRVVLEITSWDKPTINGTVKAEYKGTAGSYHGYALTGVSFTIDDIHQIHYYDNYEFKKLTGYETQLNYNTSDGRFENTRYGGDADLINAKGLLTGAKTKIIGSSQMLSSTYYYDNKGNQIQTIQRNHIGGYDQEYTNYSFTNKPTRKRMVHTSSHLGTNNITETYRYAYDHADRPTVTTYKIDNETEVILSKLNYDNLNRISRKIILAETPAHSSITGLEPIQYKYNIRGWLKEINSNSFKQNLYYHESYGGNTPTYNGNISALSWNLYFYSANRGYRFKYDGLNRLTNSEYLRYGSRDNSFKYDEITGYDRMGNITTLQRHGNVAGDDYSPTALIDDLTLQYTGNQLKSISENVTTNNFGFIKPQRTVPATPIQYNKNGALSHDFYRNISGIIYNSLNLPERIQFAHGHNTQYVYTASGIKLTTVHETIKNELTVPLSMGTTNYATSNISRLTTNYSGMNGHIIYENAAVKRIINPEGYIIKNSSSYRHFFYLKDHLGNNRSVLSWTGLGYGSSNYNQVQETNYYPFGFPYPNNHYSDSYSPQEQPYKFSGKEYDAICGS
jgi:hypothetical protein